VILRWDLALPTEALKSIRVEDVQQFDNKKPSVNEMTVTERLSQALGFKYTEDGIFSAILATSRYSKISTLSTHLATFNGYGY
jgi:hypothetical protein